jgi:hypothetical protein
MRVPLRELLEELDVRSVRLMKIDVEGYEIEVLRGFDFMASYAPENIILEYSDRVGHKNDLNACYRLLSNSGYKAFTVTGEPWLPSSSLPEENLWWQRVSVI